MAEMATKIIKNRIRKKSYRGVSCLRSMVAGRFALILSETREPRWAFDGFFAPLVLEGTHYLNTFSTEQMHSLALLFYNVNEIGGAAVGLLGSIATIGWMIVFGVNEERWTEQARAVEGNRAS